MIEDVPNSITLLFISTVIATLLWSYKATRSKAFLFIVLGWGILQSLMGLSGYYKDTMSMPPRIMLFGIFPTLLLIGLAFFTSKGRALMDGIDLKTMTYMHIIRIPVEFVLAMLFHQGLVSVYMTYEGSNFDILSGLSAPIIAYIAFRKRPIRRKLLLIWNVICLLLLLNVVITAIFAFPSPFQRIAFDQPNVAILYFPFNLLPSLIVPIVIFSHLSALRRLIIQKDL
jgi:hypothetical protein